jgi:uncharacterized protein
MELHERPAERKALKFSLEKRRSILQLGPRRVGKTWITERLSADLGPSWIVVMCDAQGSATEEALLEHMCRQIEATAGLRGLATGRLRQAYENLRKGRVDSWTQLLQTDWRAFLETLVANLAQQPRPAVIVVDEIAVAVLRLVQQGPQAPRDFLYWLRGLRQAHPNVRWFLTGSVGLDTVARRADVSGALVDLEITALQPFDEAAARSFVRRLCEDGEVLRPFALEDAGFAYLAAELGWLAPFYLDHIARHVVPSGPLGAGERWPYATPDDIEAAFSTILHRDFRTYFATWPEHLAKNFPPTETAQFRLLLDDLSATAEGETMDTLEARFGGHPHYVGRALLRDRLDALLADAFLMTTGDPDRPRYRFRSGLLRRYWRRHESV